MKKIICLATILMTLRAFAQPVALPRPAHSFIVIAHRGDHVDAPENTLAAFRNAIRHGVDFVEIDLRTTKDSELVIMHDATVDRMTDGKGRVSDLTLAEIRGLKIKATRPADTLHRVPTFEEVLQTCRNRIHIYLDFKSASVAQAYALIKKYGMARQMIVYLNEPEQYGDWRRVAPAMPLMASLPDNVKTAGALRDFLAKNPVDLLDGDYTDYNPDVLEEAKRLRLAAWPDIQSADEDRNWDKALALGFKGLQTDHPAALIDYLKKKGLRR